MLTLSGAGMDMSQYYKMAPPIYIVLFNIICWCALAHLPPPAIAAAPLTAS